MRHVIVMVCYLGDETEVHVKLRSYRGKEWNHVTSNTGIKMSRNGIELLTFSKRKLLILK